MVISSKFFFPAISQLQESFAAQLNLLVERGVVSKHFIIKFPVSSSKNFVFSELPEDVRLLLTCIKTSHEGFVRWIDTFFPLNEVEDESEEEEEEEETNAGAEFGEGDEKDENGSEDGDENDNWDDAGGVEEEEEVDKEEEEEEEDDDESIVPSFSRSEEIRGLFALSLAAESQYRNSESAGSIKSLIKVLEQRPNRSLREERELMASEVVLAEAAKLETFVKEMCEISKQI